MTTPKPYALPSLLVLERMILDGHHPRVHPNGFIQVDLDEANRLHVWHPNLPFRQKTFHPVHNHIFGFESHVYSGRLVNVSYEPTEHDEGTHAMWHAECIGGSETVLRRAPDGVRHDLLALYAFAVQPGEGYQFLAGDFHETMANEPTLTIMTKVMPKADMTTGANCQGASIMVPVGVEPDNDFRRDAFSIPELWKLIKEAHPNG